MDGWEGEREGRMKEKKLSKQMQKLVTQKTKNKKYI